MLNLMEDVMDHLDEVMHRGTRALSKFFNKRVWGDIIFPLALFIILFPYTIPVYLIGLVATFRDNRRDGVQTVRD